MRSLPSRLAFFCLLCLAATTVVANAGGGDFENTNVLRTVDLTTQLVRDSAVIVITNKGTAAATVYEFAIEDPVHLATMEAQLKKGSKKLAHTIVSKGEHTFAAITLDQPLPPNEKTTIVVSVVLTHLVMPHPKEVAQNDKQRMRFQGNFLFYSAFPTAKLKTTLLFPNEEVTVVGEDVTVSGNKATFGPSTSELQPFSHKAVNAHFTNNARFLTTERLSRTLEVSHWGNNLAVEEFYDVVHSGAKLKGHYSRLDFDRFQHNHQNTQVVKKIDFVLPVGAADVYYRDIIGNISTSHFRSSPFEALLELTPRYPLYGGWKTKWYHGYNLPLSNVMQVGSDGTYILTVPFVAPYEDAVIDDFELLVTLPEGATDIHFRSEVDMGVELGLGSIKTYLDTYGRPVLSVTRTNVVSEHNVPVQITYRFPTRLMLQEPLLLISSFFFLFVLSMFFVRLDLSLFTSPAPAKK